MSGPLCPLCRRGGWFGAHGLTAHLVDSHAHQAVAEALAHHAAAQAERSPAPQQAKCRKVRYATEREASVELAGMIVARNRGKHRRHECRVYQCLICDGWHVTSMPSPGRRSA